MGKIKSILSITTFLLIGSSTILGQQEDPAVTRFREYLRINSAHPIPDYGELFLKPKITIFKI